MSHAGNALIGQSGFPAPKELSIFAWAKLFCMSKSTVIMSCPIQKIETLFDIEPTHIGYVFSNDQRKIPICQVDFSSINPLFRGRHWSVNSITCMKCVQLAYDFGNLKFDVYQRRKAELTVT